MERFTGTILSIITILFIVPNVYAVAPTFYKHKLKDSWDGVTYVSVADLDQDGDNDILAVAVNDDDLKWWENDGAEYFREQTISASYNGAYSVEAGDIDGDGDMDLVTSARAGNDISWWENNGSESFTKRTITDSYNEGSSAFPVDMDEDGDIDVLSTSWGGDKLSWWENNGSQSFTERTVYDGLTEPLFAYPFDLDRDGDIDVLSVAGGDNDIMWFESDGTPSDGGWQTRGINFGYNGASSIHAADFDNDGNWDILGTGYYADELTWWESDGTPSDGGWTERTIASSLDGIRMAYPADIDRDGDQDIVAAVFSDNDLLWYENDGSPTDGGWEVHVLAANFTGVHWAHVADIDQDGHMDVLGAADSGDELAWWQNTRDPRPVPTFAGYNLVSSFNGSYSVESGDIDGDGDIDFVATAWEGDTISWFENDGNESFTQNLIDDSYGAAVDGFPVDLDKDGDIDILGAAYDDDEITFFENDGSENFTRRVVTSTFDGAYDVYPADIDSDGDIDIAATAWTEDQMAWFENDGTPSDGGWTEHILLDEIDEANCSFVIDVDGDGDLDVIASSYTEGDIYWFENDGSPEDGGWTEHIIINNFTGALGIDAVDLDQDGDIEILGSASGVDDIAFWNQNPDGSFTFRIVDTNFDGRDVQARDVDGDGDYDILAASKVGEEIAWYENDGTPYDGGWIKHSLTTDFSGANWVDGVDVDGDGDLDILATAETDDELKWWENKQRPARVPTWTEHDIQTGYLYSNSVYAVDLDMDGDVDILGAANHADNHTWWENDGSENFTERELDDNIAASFSAFPADVDGDNDVDIFGCAVIADDVSWFENDGDPSDGGWTEHVIDGNLNGALHVFGADMDGDGDMDVAVAALYDDDIAWYENDGTPDAGWTKNLVEGDFDGASCVYATDLDKDGDMDLIGTAQEAHDVVWWYNDGSESFTADTITNDFQSARSVVAADIDGDGDMDVVGAAPNDGEIVWWQNDGTPTNGGWTEYLIQDGLGFPIDVFVTDLDGDGDKDVLGADQTDDKVYWFENDGYPMDAGWAGHTVATGFDGAWSVYATDVDQDGDPDVIGAAYNDSLITWWENNINPAASPARYKHSIPKHGWSMIGIPVFVGDGDPASLFQDDVDDAEFASNTWRVSRWDHVNQKYVRNEEVDNPDTGGNQDPADFTPGNGYWIQQRMVDNCELDITAAQSNGIVGPNVPFIKPLNKPLSSPSRRGLTMMANPFNHIYDWRRTWVYDETNDLRKTIYEAAAANWVSGYAYKWDHWAKQYVSVQFSGNTSPFNLKRWEGFWFEQLDDSRDLLLEFIPVNHMIMNDGVEDDGWRLQLMTHAPDFDARDENNFIGVDHRSDDGYDFLDAMEFTPAASEYVQLCFEREEWEPLAEKYSWDIRSESFPDSFKVWDFSIKTWKLRNTEVILSWWKTDEIPGNYYLELRDTSNEGEVYDMHEANEVSFVTNNENQFEKSFEILVHQSPTSVDPAGDIIPDEFGLISLYPNPFNNVLRISYGLPEAVRINLSVFDIQGRFVELLFDGLMKSGRHEFAWDASHMPSGSYFIELNSGREISRNTVRLTK